MYGAEKGKSHTSENDIMKMSYNKCRIVHMHIGGQGTQNQVRSSPPIINTNRKDAAQ